VITAGPTNAAATGAPVTSLPVLDQSTPPLDGAAGWLNSPPLTPAGLLGHVVLYDFWTFGCYNCANTLPHVKAWYRRYASDGLVVVGIHTPEFDNEAVAANVADYVTAHQITYPVALDPERHIWNAWDNHYWPNFYLYDKVGSRRFTHIGEGAYDTMEDNIRALLGVDPAAPRAAV
jgi:thiol-disulfide isomerase/thioredoxin